MEGNGGEMDKTSSMSPRPFKANNDLSNGVINQEFNLKDRFCSKPWDFLEINAGGRAACCCPAWLPTSIGNLLDQRFWEVWNSEPIQAIRKSVLDGTYQFCRPANCPLISAGILPLKKSIVDERLRKIIDEELVTTSDLPAKFNLCYDNSCNLNCPSCRINHINVVTGEEYNRRLIIHQKVVDVVFSEKNVRKITLNITGSGDPFGSKLYRDFLTSIDGKKYPNVTFDFQTNGVLFTENYFEKICGIHSNIGRVAVSFDAATEATYNVLRRGGNWNQLIENMVFINRLRAEGIIKRLEIEYVVQTLNFSEMPDFVKITSQFESVDVISFSLINNWGTYSEDEFKYHAIWRADHPGFNSFLEILKSPILETNKIFWGNVSAYRKKALESMNA